MRERLRLLGVPHVDLMDYALPAGLLHERRRLLRVVRVTGEGANDADHAFLGVRHGERTADAARGSGDNSDAVLHHDTCAPCEPGGTSSVSTASKTVTCRAANITNPDTSVPLTPT